MRRAQTEGDTEHNIVMTGQVASAISELVSIAEFVSGIAAEARAPLDDLSRCTGAAPSTAAVG